MDLNHPLAVVTPTLDGDVLRILARGDAEFTPGRVHRILGGRSEEGVRKVLMRLTEQGIVLRRKVGPSFVYSLNRDHVCAPAIQLMCRAKDELLQRLRAHVATWPTPPVYGALFGSSVRRDMRATSDLDIFLVRPDDCDEDAWVDRTMALSRAATGWTGNDARIMDLPLAEVSSVPGERGALFNIARDGIAFWGDHSWLCSILSEVRTPT